MRIRKATPADIPAIAHHRAQMFLAMGRLDDVAVEPLMVETRAVLDEMMTRNEYHGWLAVDDDDPSRVLGGAGLQRRRVLPFPTGGTGLPIADGNVAIVVNVYTEPDARRRGVARALMVAVLDWAREEELDGLVLHASKDGRPLYESLGFAPTNEMRFMQSLTNS